MLVIKKKHAKKSCASFSRYGSSPCSSLSQKQVRKEVSLLPRRPPGKYVTIEVLCLFMRKNKMCRKLEIFLL